MEYLIAYIILSVVFESIYLFFGIKNFKNKLKLKPEYAQYTSIYYALLERPSIQLLKQRLWNWYTITFIFTPLFIILSPFLLPPSLFSLIKKLFGYKSKLEKEAEIEEKSAEEARIRAEEWMKNEGDMNPPFDETFFNELE